MTYLFLVVIILLIICILGALAYIAILLKGKETVKEVTPEIEIKEKSERAILAEKQLNNFLNYNGNQ